MSEPSKPDTEWPPRQESRLKQAATVVGGGVGCLLMVVVLIVVAGGVLAIFLDDPALWIAVVALVVAVAGYKASKR